MRKRRSGSLRNRSSSAGRSKRASRNSTDRETKESLIARDADQLSLILQLKECGDLGNKYSQEWIRFAVRRLATENARKLAESILETDSSNWWFKDKSDWWVNGNHGSSE